MALFVFVFIVVLIAMVMQVKHFGYCVAKVLLISVVYVSNIGIVFIRSLKILQAFRSKVRLTPEETKRRCIFKVSLSLHFEFLSMEF